MLPNDVAITPGVELALLAVIVFIFTPPEMRVPIPADTLKMDLAINPWCRDSQGFHIYPELEGRDAGEGIPLPRRSTTCGYL